MINVIIGEKGTGKTARLIDYASAGKTWDDASRLAAWIRIK